MKRKLLLVLLAAQLPVCIGLACWEQFDALTIAFFPWVKLGEGLRGLSLSSAGGNIAAILLYAGICLLPLAYLGYRSLQKRVRIEDGLLALLCAVLFAHLYMLINPGLFPSPLGVEEMSGMAGSMVVYSVALGYALLRVLRAIKAGGTDFLLHSLKILLALLCALFVFCVFTLELSGLLTQLRTLTQTNTDGADLGLSRLFLLLQYLVRVLPYAWNLAALLWAIPCIRALERSPYGEALAQALRRLGALCRLAVQSILLSQIGLHTLQFALGMRVRTVSYHMFVPLSSLLFLLGLLLFSAYFERVRQWKAEHDLFI